MIPAKNFDKRTLLILGSSIAVSAVGLLAVALLYRRRAARTLTETQKPRQLQQQQQPSPASRQEVASHISHQRHNSSSQQPMVQERQQSEAVIITKSSNDDAVAVTREESQRQTVADTHSTITTATSTTVASSSTMATSQQPSSKASTSTTFTTDEDDAISPSIAAKAKQAKDSIKELILAGVQETKRSAEKTARQLKEQTVDIAANADSKDIHSLEANDIKTMTALFEDMMQEIRKEGYNEQVTLMEAYKRLLQEHIRVIEARRTLAGRLKPGA